MTFQINVEGSPNLKRDYQSKAVVNSDRAAMEKLLSEREMKRRLANLENTVSELNTSIGDIRRMLAQLLDRRIG